MACCDSDVLGDETAHARWIRRVLSGEVVDGDVGIKTRGGPFGGRIHTVRLDAEGLPPSRIRARRSGAWQVYVLTPDAHEVSGWVYQHDGTQPEQLQL